jgi:glucosamine-6-phosphate deaminase
LNYLQENKSMEIIIAQTKDELGEKAAHQGADFIRQAIQERGDANIILATGASQFEMLAHLVKENVDWSKVTAFHLDEYIGLPESHPASFRNYLKERFASKVPLRAFHFVNGEAEDPQAECRRLGDIISAHPIDVAFVGIGENGHLAFNDPPADFETEEPYLVVELDEACRRQQLGEGWFASLDEVPRRAISMSIRQILKSQVIICSVPDLRKADAVKKAVEGPATPRVPASILQTHPRTFLYLDRDSASLLSDKK